MMIKNNLQSCIFLSDLLDEEENKRNLDAYIAGNMRRQEGIVISYELQSFLNSIYRFHIYYRRWEQK